MTLFVLLLSFFFSGTPLFKDSIQDRADQLEKCADGGCVRN